jgi:hypothetical protein
MVGTAHPTKLLFIGYQDKEEIMVGYIRSNLTAALLLTAVIAAPSNLAFAENSTASGKSAGRFVALQPPSAGDNTYGNFLWVLDTVTGKVVVYRISNIKNAQGELDAWVTERLWTEEEYAKYLSSQNKPETPDWAKKH